jgi:hypothetical protein
MVVPVFFVHQIAPPPRCAPAAHIVLVIQQRTGCKVELSCVWTVGRREAALLPRVSHVPRRSYILFSSLFLPAEAAAVRTPPLVLLFVLSGAPVRAPCDARGFGL